MVHDVIQVFIWICALGAAVAIPMSLRKSRTACVTWISLYLLAYAYLSVHGSYVGGFQSSRWAPLHCEKTVRKGPREVPALNIVGAFFSPLLMVDRFTIHRGKVAHGTLI